MNDIFHINLGGQPLTINEDAYKLLSSYISRLEKHFKLASGAEEIIDDIEMRMAELLTERLGARKIIEATDIEAVIDTMGRPTDFSRPEMETPTFKPGKKLFKDPVNKRVAGVCAGLSCYFGIEDPIWLRLMFVFFVFLGAGFPILLYVALWVLLPNAVTPHDRLHMKGEPINIESIASYVEDEFNSLSDTIQKKWAKK